MTTMFGRWLSLRYCPWLRSVSEGVYVLSVEPQKEYCSEKMLLLPAKDLSGKWRKIWPWVIAEVNIKTNEWYLPIYRVHHDRWRAHLLPLRSQFLAFRVGEEGVSFAFEKVTKWGRSTGEYLDSSCVRLLPFHLTFSQISKAENDLESSIILI